MKTLSGTALNSFAETLLGTEILILANVVIAAAGVLFLSGADPLVRGTGLRGGKGDVTSGRMHFWSVAWQIFLEHPIAGAGFDAFGVAFTRLDTWNGYFRVEQAHNDYLQMLADGKIHPEELDLLQVTDDPEEVVKIIKKAHPDLFT